MALPTWIWALTLTILSAQLISADNSTMTAPPSNSTSNQTSAPAAIQTTGSAANQTSAQTTIQTTPSAASTSTVQSTTSSAPQIIPNIVFTTNENFTTDLLNSSSAAFQNRSIKIKQLEPFIRSAFPSFNSLTLVSCSSGSIVHNTSAAFGANVTVPNITSIYSVISNAAKNLTATLPITFVNGIAVNSAGTARTSLLAAPCLVVMSLLAWQ
ncbi:uncharacterized protein LOC114785863 [Denticeps clupeoides]|uniref:uncharacterized protein LOC114785863 n=1 Tax=Denticeps clupeoides TaxID=299321 RepID=UPI0010A4D8F9|nr:uncharacterized protein LOC114785863 [Denticeps clupeoides]